MKQTTRTSRTSGYLEKIFRACNARYFGGTLEEPIITIQSTPRAYGHVTVSKAWSKADGETRHELNIAAGTLDRPIENVVATMIHEMVHLYCIANNIKDTSRGGTYHNKRFKEEAEKRDLHIDHDSRIGYSITSPTDALMEFILEQGWSEIMMNRQDGYTARGTGTGAGQTGTGADPAKKTSSTRKYRCPCCGNSVRATKDVNIICGDCMVPMVKVEKK